MKLEALSGRTIKVIDSIAESPDGKRFKFGSPVYKEPIKPTFETISEFPVPDTGKDDKGSILDKIGRDTKRTAFFDERI